MSEALAGQIRNLGLNCPDAFGQTVPAEGVGPDAEAKSLGELLARAGTPESVIAPQAELAQERDHMMTRHP